jgi:hypothetical protein
MNTLIKSLAFSSVAALSSIGLSGGAALAESAGTMYQANLTALNKSGDSGNSTVTLHVDGNKVTVRTTSTSPELPHAQHIHIGGRNQCPTTNADANNDGFIDTKEGEPDYGPVEVSLTTTGDVSKDSAIAVDRFPTANADGTVTYERVITLPEGVSEDDVANGVIVQHGISELFDDKAKYDGEKKSSLKEDLPLEATVPATCGKLVAMPTGGAGAGSGGVSGIENAGILAVGAASLLAAGAFAYRRSGARS